MQTLLTRQKQRIPDERFPDWAPKKVKGYRGDHDLCESVTGLVQHGSGHQETLQMQKAYSNHLLGRSIPVFQKRNKRHLDVHLRVVVPDCLPSPELGGVPVLRG